MKESCRNTNSVSRLLRRGGSNSSSFFGIGVNLEQREACNSSRLSNTSETEPKIIVSVYPNPTNNKLIIKDASSYEGIKITDISGKEIKQEVSKEVQGDDIILNVSRMTAGIYFINAIDTKTDKTIVSKFIKI